MRPLLCPGGIAISVVLFASAQPPLGIGWIASVALVPWLLVTTRAGIAGGIVGGFAFGTASGIATAYWIHGALGRLGATSLHAGTGVLLVALLGAGVPWGVVGGVAAGTRAWPVGLRVGAVTLTLFAVDVARCHLPVGLPWVLLGQTQWNVSGVAQLAVLGGIPTISALLMAANVAIAAAIQAHGRERLRAVQWAAAALGAWTALASFGVRTVEAARSMTNASSTTAHSLLLVQPNIPPSERWVRSVQRTSLAIVGRQTQSALAKSSEAPDLVVWPETVVTNPVDEDTALRGDLLAWVDRIGVPVILGALRSSGSGTPGYYRNSALWLDPGQGIVAQFDKTRAIPVIESATRFPGRQELSALMGLSSLERYVEEGTEQRPLRGSASFAVALCYEALYPGLVAARRDADTLAILNLANDSWFVSEVPSRQQVAFVAFRAIEQRLWLLRVAHGGISAAIDPYGRVVAELPFDTKGTLTVSVSPEPPPTVVERIALVGLLLVGATMGWIAAAAFGRRFA